MSKAPTVPACFAVFERCGKGWRMTSRPLLLIILALFVVTPGALAITDWQSQIFEEVRQIYEPVSASSHRKFRIVIKTESPAVAASVEREATEDRLIVHQGFLQSPKLTADSLRITLCHELGHLFAGAPRSHAPTGWEGPLAPDGLSYFSSEGQSDYYASAVCFRRLAALGGSPGAGTRESRGVVPASVLTFCNQVWGDTSPESGICQRAAVGGFEFLRMNFEFPISFETPDLSVAPEVMRDYYPARQCRLDTILAGALCRDERNFVWDFSRDELSECSSQVGRRPRCWFP
jgi:hypothetical protein